MHLPINKRTVQRVLPSACPGFSSDPLSVALATAGIILGDKPSVGPVFEKLFQLLDEPTHGSASGGTPRSIVYEPRIAREHSWPAPETLPLLFYLPGIDGTGLAAYRQFASLSQSFDLRALFMPPTERQPFDQLVEHVAAQVCVCEGN